MADEITSIAELLERIEQSEKHGCADDWTPEGQGYNNGLKRAIELIYKLEVSVRERIISLKTAVISCRTIRGEELHRILCGEGERRG